MNCKYLGVALLPLALLACSGDDGAAGSDGQNGADGQDLLNTTIALTFAGRYSSGTFDESAAEIVTYDSATQQAFVVNANSGQVDVIDISSPSTPTKMDSLNVAADVAAAISALSSADQLGAANSVAVNNGVIAVAIEADNKQDTGYVALYQTDGTFLTAVEAGALPDMLTFTPDGNHILVANEGEPSGDYRVDPEGSVTLIDISGGAASVTPAQVTQLSFAQFNTGASKAAMLDEQVRLSSKSASIAQDLEPEYITVAADSQTAWVALQENNAIAVVDIVNSEITRVVGLGYKDHSLPGNELDASNRDGGINIRDWPVRGLFMPDSIDSYNFNGTTYLVTANEGDGREYLTETASEAECVTAGGFDFDNGDCLHYLDEIRLKDIEDTGASILLGNLSRFATDVAELSADENLGRIKIVANMGVENCMADTFATTGQPSAGCEYSALYTYGARSFSIWNGSTGELVFDSGNDFELITAQRLGEDFNASNDENGGDDRSDDKGPEPEAIEIGQIEGKTYAFIGLERVGGIMVYDISNPENTHFIQYINTRDFTVDIPALAEAGDFGAAGDLGPESIYFVDASQSPSGEALLLVGNEVSGTLAIFEINLVSQ